jgi:hypothetical protein
MRIGTACVTTTTIFAKIPANEAVMLVRLPDVEDCNMGGCTHEYIENISDGPSGYTVKTRMFKDCGASSYCWEAGWKVELYQVRCEIPGYISINNSTWVEPDLHPSHATHQPMMFGGQHVVSAFGCVDAYARR